MKTSILCAAIAVALIATPMVSQPAQAQAKGKKLYRWVDKDGKVHYDDALPPEAVDQARKEFSAKTGSTTGSIDRALTPEERAAKEAADKEAALEAVKAAEQKRQEEAMLASYQDESDLRRAYDDRISLLKQTLESTDVGLKAIRASLATMLAQASESELANRPVDGKRAATIREMHAEMVKQQVFQDNRQAELLSLDAEFQRMLERYRELRAAQPSQAAAGPTP